MAIPKPQKPKKTDLHAQPTIDRDPNERTTAGNPLLYVPFAEFAGLVLIRKPVGYTVEISDPEQNRFVPCALVNPRLPSALFLGHSMDRFGNEPKRGELS